MFFYDSFFLSFFNIFHWCMRFFNFPNEFLLLMPRFSPRRHVKHAIVYYEKLFTTLIKDVFLLFWFLWIFLVVNFKWFRIKYLFVWVKSLKLLSDELLLNTEILITGEEKYVSSEYIIENMDRHKGGTYICTANNGVGQTASSQIALHVLCKFKFNFFSLLLPWKASYWVKV